ncbi:MAG: hypothetical protein CMD72_03780 [Gammaproteobacteria bacterium]|nr:hypothetical protein [Gammaproteobacteria bacterium]|tara:strand:+ start:264 stop:1379 length:1116 start_codon:yes stop_codon:yes gene_type:complete
MNKKTIGYFTTCSTNVGVFNQLVNLAINLDKSKYSAVFILSNTIIENELILRLKKNNIEVLSLNSNKYYNFLQLFKLVDLLKKKKIDILHTRLRRCDFYGNLSKFFYKSFVVNNIVDDHYDHFTKFHTFFSGILGKIYNIFLKQSDIILVNSQENLQHYNKLGYKVFFLNNGINTNLYKKNIRFREKLSLKHSLNNDSFNVGFVGEFKKIKGINLLFSIIREFKNNKNINFIICAGGNYLKKEFVEEFKDYNNVYYLGFVENIIEYYSLFNIQIYTSHSEGMQNVMLESLSSGVPAICPDAPGYSSIVDSKKGFLVERVYSEYVKKIIYLEKNRNILKDISYSAERVVRSEHNFIEITRELESIYVKFDHE